MKKSGLMMKAMPYLLIVLGIYTLNMFQGYVALACMLIGIVLFIERVWPEKWGGDEKSHNNI